MHARIVGLILSLILIFSGFLCEEEKKEPAPLPRPVPVVKPKEPIQSVCIWDITPVKSDPAERSKIISSLALGEKILWLNEEKTDLSDGSKKYLKIKLSDGKEGWVPEHTVVTDSKPAVAIQKSKIYQRPDLVTVTNDAFDPMEFMAVSLVKNEWCEVKGPEGKKAGWIKSETVSYNDEDIAVALLANKALAETDKIKKKEKLTEIINNPIFVNSFFIDTLKYSLSKLDVKPKKPKKVQEEIPDNEF